MRRRELLQGLLVGAFLLTPMVRAFAKQLLEYNGELPAPEAVQRVFAAGPPAAVFLYVLVPEKLLGWPMSLNAENLAYIHPDQQQLPFVGRLAGRGSTVSLETLLVLAPQLIVDVGNAGATHRSAAQRVTQKTDIATLQIEGLLAQTPQQLREAGALLGAGISLLKILADPYTQLPTITFWLLGGLHSVSLSDLTYSVPLMLLGLTPLVLLRWRMNLLSLSDDEASALGVNLIRTRLLLNFSATLMTASAVSFTGIIGWVGLVIPHIARLLVGPHFSRLLPVSLLLGATFLLLTDTLARNIAGIELPLGILTALVGAPFFMYLLARSGR